jgi:acyl transferase domain-containing protein
MVVEEAPPAPERRPPELSYALVPLSARDEAGLKASAAELASCLERLRAGVDPEGWRREGPPSIHDIAFTLQLREAFEERLALVVDSPVALQASLAQFVSKSTVPEGCFRAKVKICDQYTLDEHERLRNAPEFRPDGSLTYLRETARAWSEGATFRWSERAGEARRLAALPGYPFRRKSYWLKSKLAPDPRDVGPQLPAPQDAVSRFPLEGTEFFFEDHRLRDEPVLPGVMSLELVRTKAKAAWGLEVKAFYEVTWNRPLVHRGVGAIDAALEIEGPPNARCFALQAPNGDGSLMTFCEGRIGSLATAAAAEVRQDFCRAALDASRTACFSPMSAENHYRALEEAGFTYGPRFRTVREIRFGSSEAVVRLQLSKGALDSYRDMTFHPCLLDGAFQAVAAVGSYLEGRRPRVAMPFAVEAIELLKPLEAECWVSIRPAAVDPDSSSRMRAFNLSIMDVAGEPLVQVRNLAFIEPDGSAKPRESISSILKLLEGRVLSPEAALRLVEETT